MRRGEDPLRVDERGAANLEAEGLKRRRERVREGVGGHLGAAHDAGRHTARAHAQPSARCSTRSDGGTKIGTNFNVPSPRPRTTVSCARFRLVVVRETAYRVGVVSLETFASHLER